MIFVFFFRFVGVCIVVVFLKEFVIYFKWAYLDIVGVMINKDEISYLRKGMIGRFTRILIEFLFRFS